MQFQSRPLGGRSEFISGDDDCHPEFMGIQRFDGDAGSGCYGTGINSVGSCNFDGHVMRSWATIETPSRETSSSEHHGLRAVVD